jgi:hypothetical protein
MHFCVNILPSCCIEYGGNDCEFDKCPDVDVRKEFMKCYLSQLPLFSDVDRSEAHRMAQQVGAGAVNAEDAEQFLMGLDVSNPVRYESLVLLFCASILEFCAVYGLSCTSYVGSMGYYARCFIHHRLRLSEIFFCSTERVPSQKGGV